MALGSKAWNRSKIMFVGEGRAGKTALCNSMMGKQFEETESTVGLTQLTCDVWSTAATSNGRWTEYTKPEREFEAGVAQLVRNMKSLKPAGNELKHQTSKKVSNMPSDPDNNAPLNGDADHTFNADEIFRVSKLESSRESTRSFNETSVNNGVPQFKSDVSLVMKHLAEVKVRDADLILSLFDFGGQSVFNIIHHLFLTSDGVYVVVFNMMDILDYNKRELSLSEMSFWINSIVMHTRDAKTDKIAPIFLVGTHKDYISDNANFEQISQIIEKRFQYHVGWPLINENKNMITNHSFCFFPVNNKQGLLDNVVIDLMSAIENVAKVADCVKEPRPLTWLKALDELVATKKSVLAMEEATTIAVASGVEEDTVTLFLSFLNEMGVVLWLDEEGLRDVVILDVITFFVEPATLIICNHIAKPSDGTIHHKKIQEVCRKNRAKDWFEMTQRGLVSKQLMEFFLAHNVEDCNIPVVINMMLKYGLIVRFVTKDLASDVCELPAHLYSTYFLVPALLTAVPRDSSMFQDESWKNISSFNSCYFVFTTDANFVSSKSYDVTTLQSEGFLPRGLMERLVCKAVKWIQLTDIRVEPRLFQNYAALLCGNQEFRLVCIPGINCIRLDIEGEHPLPVYNRIYEQIDLCIKECMGSLQFIAAIRLSTDSESEDRFTLLNLEAVRNTLENGSLLRIGGRPPINRQEVKRNYGQWFINTDMLPFYDVFISHRWHKDDDEVIEHLNFAIRESTLGSQYRAVQLFYDKDRLKVCQQFQKAFGRALVNSTIFVPILCTTALQKMLSHNSADEDNVLIEWMLALECVQNPIHSKMRGIYPLMFGQRSADGSVGDLFAEGVIDRLPDIIPAASIEVVRRLLEEHGFTASSYLTNLTVRGVVKEICKYMGLEGWRYPDGFINVASEAIVKHLDDFPN